jgi:hypothetical protein
VRLQKGKDETFKGEKLKGGDYKFRNNPELRASKIARNRTVAKW